MKKKKKGNLIIFLNRRCTVGCATCNVNATPDSPVYLSPEWLEHFFSTLPSSVLDFSGYIIWTGGEPFLSFPSLLKGIQIATTQSHQSEILTSGTWFQSHPEYLENLEKAGRFSIRISLDAEHQPRVPAETIIRLISRALDLKIEVNFTLRYIPGSQETPDTFINLLKQEMPSYYEENRNRSRWLHYLPHMPIHALNGSQSHTPEQMALLKQNNKWRGPCKMGFKDIIVGPDGLYYPCCGLFGVENHQRLSSHSPQSFSTGLHTILKEKGPYGICKELKLSPENLNWPGFETPCDLCLALFHLHGRQIFIND